MTAALLFAIWTVIAVAVGLVIGGVIRRADEQEGQSISTTWQWPDTAEDAA